LLQRLAPTASKSFSPAMHPVRCLILTPTRELAIQVYESVKTYGKHIPLRPFVVYGGVNINPQITELRKGVEILVATPGRLLDLMGQKAVDLRQVQILVLDEADRMLDMGFIPDIKRILHTLPAVRQTLLFSATFSEEIRKLSAQFLRDPATVEVARRNTPAELVTQYAYQVDGAKKRALLAHLVKANNWTQVLVFCKTKHGANRLAGQLNRDGVQADAIHGNKAQNARIRSLEGFKAGEIRVLVATDIAARGLDIEALPHVVNFDMPHVAEDYVHRIGRTGRAGLEGEAISLVSSEERGLMSAIEGLIKKKIERREVPGFSESAAQAADHHEERAPRRGGRGESRRGQPPEKREQRAPRSHAPREPARCERAARSAGTARPEGTASREGAARPAGGARPQRAACAARHARAQATAGPAGAPSQAGVSRQGQRESRLARLPRPAQRRNGAAAPSARLGPGDGFLQALRAFVQACRAAAGRGAGDAAPRPRARRPRPLPPQRLTETVHA
jgi:ATP-dependent RNA helicase RhlE